MVAAHGGETGATNTHLNPFHIVKLNNPKITQNNIWQIVISATEQSYEVYFGNKSDSMHIPRARLLAFSLGLDNFESCSVQHFVMTDHKNEQLIAGLIISLSPSEHVKAFVFYQVRRFSPINIA